MTSREDDEEDSEEDMFILLEVTGIIDSETILKRGSCRILGLTTANPILQIGNNVFTGEYKETVGTRMFFAEKESQDKASETNDRANLSHKGGPYLEYICKADRKLELQRVILKPKTPPEEPKEKEGTSDAPPK